MKKLITLYFISIIVLSGASCSSDKSKSHTKTKFKEVVTESYQLFQPIENINVVLILFGGFSESAEDIRREFDILKTAKNNHVAVIFLNYHKRLWLEESDQKQLANQLRQIFSENNLPQDRIFIGGFSIGGNIALLLSDYLHSLANNKVKLKGVFVIDSPVDLAELYEGAEKNVKRNFSEVSVQEGSWLLKVIGKKMGNPKKNISEFEKYSPYTLRTANINNLKALKNTRIRLYTEPDTLWWKRERQADYEQLNAYSIKQLSEQLKEAGFVDVQCIQTKDKGYRSNGERHPHSWSIVDTEQLLSWMLE